MVGGEGLAVGVGGEERVVVLDRGDRDVGGEVVLGPRDGEPGARKRAAELRELAPVNALELRVEAVALPIASSNVNTDQIIPARFLRKQRAEGFGQYLFHDLRFDDHDNERADFALNQAAYRDDLEKLWTEHNEAGPGKTAIHNEYLEVIGTRL